MEIPDFEVLHAELFERYWLVLLGLAFRFELSQRVSWLAVESAFDLEQSAAPKVAFAQVEFGLVDSAQLGSGPVVLAQAASEWVDSGLAVPGFGPVVLDFEQAVPYFGQAVLGSGKAVLDSGRVVLDSEQIVLGSEQIVLGFGQIVPEPAA